MMVSAGLLTRLFSCPCLILWGQVCERIHQNGEPGFAWLENMRTYGRMGDEKNDHDSKAMGGNPCLEQTLESFEMCCLVETFPDKHESLEDFLETLRSVICTVVYGTATSEGFTAGALWVHR